MSTIAVEVLFGREADGRWIAEIPAIPGCMAYGESKKDARDAVVGLGIRVIQSRVPEHEKHRDAELMAKALASGRYDWLFG